MRAKQAPECGVENKVKCVKKLIMCVALLSLSSPGWAESDRGASDARLDHAGRVIAEIMAAPDKGIPQEVLEHARCVAVVPHMLKGCLLYTSRCV